MAERVSCDRCPAPATFWAPGVTRCERHAPVAEPRKAASASERMAAIR